MLDITRSIIVIANDPAGLAPSSVSVEAWIKPTVNGGVVFRWRWYGYDVRTNGFHSWSSSSNEQTISTNQSLTDGAWHHIVATKSATELRFYIDGQLATSAAMAPGIYYGTPEVAIGRDGLACNGAYPSFTGDMARVAVYGYALSPAQVAAHLGARSAVPVPQLPSASWGADNPGRTGPPFCTTGDPINCATGNFFESIDDLVVPGRGRQLHLTRTYNAHAAVAATSPGVLGWGWTHSYDKQVTTEAATGHRTVHHANGSTVTFGPKNGAYVAPEEVIATLADNGDGTLSYTYPDQVVDVFDSSTGRLLREVDRNSHQTVLAYVNGRLATVTEPAGRSLTFAYDAGGRVSTVTDHAARSVSYGYDAAGDLTSATDVTGEVTTFGYDTRHRITTVTDANGGVTTNVYDSSDRVTSQTNPAGETIGLAYSSDAVGAVTTITDPLGHVSVEHFDARRNLLSLTRGVGTPRQATWTHTYDSAGNRTSTVDPNNHTRRFTWDTRGNQLSATDALQRTTTASYDTHNRLLTLTDALGVTTTFTYDANGNPTSVRTPLGAGMSETTYSYATTPARRGDPVGVTDPGGGQHGFEYDSFGNLTASTDPVGNRATFAYRPDGHLVSSVSPRGNAVGAIPASFTTSYSHDAAGRLLEVTDPLGRHQEFTYDAVGNRVSATDAVGRTTAYAYDAANRPIATARPDGTAWTTAYDDAGNMTAQTDGAGRTTSYAHDELNRVLMTTDPLSRATQYAYDAAGNRTLLMDAAGRTTALAYDAADQLTGIDYSDPATPDVAFTYDANGRRKTMADGTGTTRYSWDARGQLQGLTDGADNQLTYTRDGAGRVTALSDSFGYTALTTYDLAGRMLSVGDGGSITASFGYDRDSNLTTITRGDGTHEARTYNAAGELLHQLDVGPNATILDLHYTYADIGNVATETASPTTPAATKSYAYDLADRLKTVVPAANLAAAAPTTYGYSGGDDLQTVDRAGVVTTFGVDAAAQLISATTGTRQVSYTNDVHGNRTGWTDSLGNEGSYTFDQANRLVRSAGPVLNATNPLTGIPVEVSYEYNGDGLRTGKGVAVDGAEVHLGDTWDHSTPIPLLVSAGFTSLWYGPGGMPVAQSPAPLVSNYLHTDRLNSVRAVTDASGNLTATASYDAYGRQTGTIDAVSTPLGFAGERQDAETGFVYLRARYYDPATGRFLHRDPLIALTGQPYAYANNDPLNTVDPTGLIGFQIGPVKVGDGCPLGKNPNGSCRGSDASNSLKVGAAALGGTALLAGAVVIAVPTAAVAGVSVATIGTALAIGSTAASWGVAGVDCSRSRDRNCAASVAEAVGGTVTLGASSLAFRTGDALLGTASNVTGWALDQAAFLKFPNGRHGRAVSGVPGVC